MLDPTPAAATSGTRSSTVAQEFLPAAPDAHCPYCIALAQFPFPPNGAARRTCSEHLALLRRLQCRGWNADAGHQALAGHASWNAFSARWRAAQGLAPLFAEAARKYLMSDHIRGPFGLPLLPELQATIYRA